MDNSYFHIATIPGDGIGKDIVESAISIVDLSSEIIGGYKCQWEPIQAGAEYYSLTGKDVEPEGEKKIDELDSIFLGAIGLPGTSGFVGELLVLIGAFKESFLVATIASLGVVIGAAYMLWLYKRVVFGKIININLLKMSDLNKSELFILSSLALTILFFGFYPDPLLSTVDISINNLLDTYNYKINIIK